MQAKRQQAKVLTRQHLQGLVLAAVVASGVAGCGKSRSPVAPQVVAQGGGVVSQGGGSLAPVAVGTGSIAMNFKLPYRLAATSADIGLIEVALRQRVFLLWRTLGTARVTREQMLAGKAAVQFTGLAAGSYELKIDALSDKMVKLAATTAPATVKDGETTTVAANLKMGVL